MQLDPTDVHEAELALQKAEQAWSERDPDEPSTLDLAVIAQRKAQIAEAEAAAIKAQQDARSRPSASSRPRWRRSSRPPAGSSTRPAGARRDAGAAPERAGAGRRAAKQLAELEAKLKDARDTIAKIAAVKDDDRGMVITLQGEVLFKTGKWDLKAGAMAKLDQIADALKRQGAADRRLRLHRQRRHPRQQHGPLAEARAVRARLPREQGHSARTSSRRRARAPTSPSRTTRRSRAARRTAASRSSSSRRSRSGRDTPSFYGGGFWAARDGRTARSSSRGSRSSWAGATRTTTC